MEFQNVIKLLEIQARGHGQSCKAALERLNDPDEATRQRNMLIECDAAIRKLSDGTRQARDYEGKIMVPQRGEA